MKYVILAILSMILIMQLSHAQVGINTANPVADLEIVSITPPAAGAFNGVVVPKVAALPGVVGPSGLVVYLTTQDGTNNPGLYFSNGTAYINVTDVAADSKAFVETAAPTVAANNTTANITRTGNVSVGSTLNSGKLNVEIVSANTAANSTGIKVENRNTGTANSNTYGIFSQNFASNIGEKIGVRSTVSATGIGTHIGLDADVTDATGETTNYGVRSMVGATDIVSSKSYGVYSEIGTPSSRGTNYAVYAFSNHGSETTSADKSYSGYFRGDNFAIRNEDDSTGYNMPVTTGTVGQVLTTQTISNGIATTAWITPNATGLKTNIRTIASGTALESDHTLILNGDIGIPAATIANTGQIYILILGLNQNNRVVTAIGNDFAYPGDAAAFSTFGLNQNGGGARGITIQSNGTNWYIIDVLRN